MKKEVVIIITVILATIIVTSSLGPLVQAESSTILSRGIVAGKEYTQINVVLGNSNNTVRIPDNWNGRLVVLCRGSSSVPVSPNEIPLDTQSKYYVSLGYATAANHFSFSSGFSQKEAKVQTHQLTEYVLTNYDVTYKAILVGVSFGGGVALLLGEKYPDLYNGVLDIVGTKDAKTGYEWLKHCADSSLSDLTAEFAESNLSPFPYATIADFQRYALITSDRMLDRFGGMPEEKPEAYEKESPTYHANIQIPVITICGAKDALVPLSQHLLYQTAVDEAGSAGLYRLVTVEAGAHFDLPVQQQITSNFQKLVSWVLTGIPPL